MKTSNLIETLKDIGFDTELIYRDNIEEASENCLFLYGEYLVIRKNGEVVAKINTNVKHVYTLSHRGFFLLPEDEKQMIHLLAEEYSWTPIKER